MSLALSREENGGVDVVIEELIMLSSLDDKIGRFSAGVVENIENDRSSMPVAIFNKYKEIVISIFDSSVLKKNVRSVILEHYDEKKMGQMIGFLKYPQVVLMSQSEESSKSPEAAQEMRNFVAGFQVSPPTEQRKRLIEKIDRVKRSSSFVVDMQAELFKAITWGMRGLSPEDKKITEDQLKGVVLDMKAQFGAHMEQQVWMGMLFAYKDVADSELEKYISLHETIEGRQTTEFIQSAYFGVHEQVAAQLQHALSAEFG